MQKIIPLYPREVHLINHTSGSIFGSFTHLMKVVARLTTPGRTLIIGVREYSQNEMVDALKRAMCDLDKTESEMGVVTFQRPPFQMSSEDDIDDWINAVSNEALEKLNKGREVIFILEPALLLKMMERFEVEDRIKNLNMIGTRWNMKMDKELSKYMHTYKVIEHSGIGLPQYIMRGTNKRTFTTFTTDDSVAGVIQTIDSIKLERFSPHRVINTLRKDESMLYHMVGMGE